MLGTGNWWKNIALHDWNTQSCSLKWYPGQNFYKGLKISGCITAICCYMDKIRNGTLKILVQNIYKQALKQSTNKLQGEEHNPIQLFTSIAILAMGMQLESPC